MLKYLVRSLVLIVTAVLVFSSAGKAQLSDDSLKIILWGLQRLRWEDHMSGSNSTIVHLFCKGSVFSTPWLIVLMRVLITGNGILLLL